MALSQTCNEAKSHMCAVDTFTDLTNHLVDRNINSLRKKITFLFFRIQLMYYICTIILNDYFVQSLAFEAIAFNIKVI